MRLFLIRHPDKVRGLDSAVEGGQPLSELGVQQARALKEIIHGLAPSFRRIVVSPRTRTRQTLNLLEVQGPPPIVSPLAYIVDRMYDFDTLVGKEPGDVLVVGHIDMCLQVEEAYYRRFGKNPNEQPPIPMDALIVINIEQRAITRYPS